MPRLALSAIVLGLVLLVTGPALLSAGPADAAGGCLSAGQVRQAVQSGRAIQLSSVLPQIRAAVPGQIVSEPLLCDMGGRLLYLVDVLHGGVVTHVQIDAQTGGITF